MALNAEPSTRRWLPSHVYDDLDAAEAAVRFLIASYSTPGDPRRGPYVLAVEDGGSGRLIGHVGFSPLDGEVEVSYAIAEEARGRSLGAAAVTLGCDWLARTFGVSSVIALTATANIASRRMLERTGFACEGDEFRSFQGARENVSRYRWQAGSTVVGKT